MKLVSHISFNSQLILPTRLTPFIFFCLIYLWTSCCNIKFGLDFLVILTIIMSELVFIAAELILNVILLINGLAWKIFFLSLICINKMCLSFFITIMMISQSWICSYHTSHCARIRILAIIICISTWWAYNEVWIVTYVLILLLL